MFEEIISIRKLFNRFIVVDAVCSKDQMIVEEMGQMILVDQRRIIYHDGQKLYFYDHEFQDDQFRVRLTDSFKAGESHKVLHDAIYLSYNGVNVQILFYFNKDVIR